MCSLGATISAFEAKFDYCIFPFSISYSTVKPHSPKFLNERYFCLKITLKFQIDPPLPSVLNLLAAGP